MLQGISLGDRWDSNPRHSEPQSDALTDWTTVTMLPFHLKGDAKVRTFCETSKSFRAFFRFQRDFSTFWRFSTSKHLRSGRRLIGNFVRSRGVLVGVALDGWVALSTEGKCEFVDQTTFVISREIELCTEVKTALIDTAKGDATED